MVGHASTVKQLKKDFGDIIAAKTVEITHQSFPWKTAMNQSF
jgi:uncharacterized phage-associated protein